MYKLLENINKIVKQSFSPLGGLFIIFFIYNHNIILISYMKFTRYEKHSQNGQYSDYIR